MIGTLDWMAPEIEKEKYGHPIDVFSFGLVAVYTKTGICPLGMEVHLQGEYL